MLNVLIPYIDQQFTEFNKKYGLAERVTEQGEENGKSYPGVYAGGDNYTEINLEGNISYHRINGRVTVQDTDENTMACTKGITVTYPMVMIAAIKRDNIEDCKEFSTDTISNGLSSRIIQTKFSKATRSLVKASFVEANVTGINNDRDEVWNQEYSNVDNAARFEYAYISIYYDIVVKAGSSCLPLLDCVDPIILPPTCAEIATIPNRELTCLTAEQLEYIASSILGALPSISAFPVVSGANYNIGTVISCTTGTWLNTPMTYTYQWQRDAVDIPGQTGSTYTLTTSDTSSNLIRCIVTASNNYGSAKAGSNSIIPTLDPAAAAAFVAAGLVDTSQQVLLNTAIVSAKQAGLFGPTCLALYPFVGGTTNRHKINYKNPADTDAAYRILFAGGVTHNANGITGNGISGFGNTFIVPNTALTNNNCTVMVYSRTNTDATTWEINARNNDNSNSLGIICSGASANTFHQANDGSLTAFVNSLKTGLWAVVRTGGLKILYQNGIQRLVSTLAATGRSTNPINLLRASGGTAAFSSKNICFAAVYNEDLNATQQAALYTIVQTLQTGLGRQV